MIEYTQLILLLDWCHRNEILFDAVQQVYQVFQRQAINEINTWIYQCMDTNKHLYRKIIPQNSYSLI